MSQLPDPRLNLNGNVKTTLWRNYTRIILDLNVEDIVARRNFPQNYILDGSQDVHKTSKHFSDSVCGRSLDCLCNPTCP